MAINQFQIAVTPVLYSTTDAAKQRFGPHERGCYFEDEVTLTYLPTELFHYDISNCLFEATYEKVLEICNCTPYFHWGGVRKQPAFCRGKSLLCMNDILSKIGEYTEVENVDPESGEVKNMTCLAACEDQQNNVAMTTSKFPNRQTLMEWPDFCLLVGKLWKLCNQSWKRVDLDIFYPNLCSLLKKMLEHHSFTLGDFKDNGKCKKMFVGQTDSLTLDLKARNSSTKMLLDLIHEYSRNNLAHVHVYIKPPVVTRIQRDQRTPLIWFVANCGGILGLCMGFSIVTVFEVLHFLCHSMFGKVATRFKVGSKTKRKKSPINQEVNNSQRGSCQGRHIELEHKI